MRTFWQVISMLSVLHVIGALALLGWLVGTQRVNRERVDRGADLFRLTIAQEQRATEQAALEGEADPSGQVVPTMGFQSTEQRLDADRRRQSIERQQAEGGQSGVRALARRLELARGQLEREQQELREEQLAFDQRVAQWQEVHNEEGFKQTVSLYEQLPPKQVKQMFNALMDQPAGIDRVVQYLSAMQPRKAGAVLGQYKQPSESARAAELTERLRAPSPIPAGAQEVLQ